MEENPTRQISSTCTMLLTRGELLNSVSGFSVFSRKELE